MLVMSRLIASIVVLALTALAKPPHSYPTLGRVVREDPRLDVLLSQDARIEVVASGFEWAEGPVWDETAGGLLFSDIPRNTIFRWTAQRGAELWMKPSGFTGTGDYSAEPGSNGLLLDAKGRLILMEHGDRRVSLWEAGRGKVTLADNFDGKRLNSPNDGALKSNGDLYFTDPPYGLPKKADDPGREMDFCGVYRYSQGKLTLLTKELSRPNGIAFSPDEKTLYVANSDPQRAIWMAYPVKEDGTLGPGRVFADVTAMAAQLPGLPDGMKIDREGNLWAAGPGGIHIMTPDGKRLGRIETGEATANCAWGDDGSTLYITADMYVCRIHTKAHGAGGRAALRK
jgi:gluconolactonase